MVIKQGDIMKNEKLKTKAYEINQATF